MNELKLRPCGAQVLRSILVALFVAACSTPVLAGGGPENCLVVVNRADPTSLLIANHYVRLRQIPPTNVVYLTGIPKRTFIDVETFQTKILKPIVAAIQERKLESQIDYIVYSAGFPSAVDVKAHQPLFFEQAKQNGQGVNESMQRLFNPRASLTSLTFHAIPVLADSPVYFSLSSNNYFRRQASSLLTRPFVRDLEVRYADAVLKIKTGSVDEAITELEAIAEANPAQIAVSYQLARAYAKKSDAKLASEWLARAVRGGFYYRSYIQDDEAFANIKSDPLFTGLVQQIPDEQFDFVMSHGFSSRFNWAVNGSINGTNEQGANYFLSTMLAYTWDTGISEQDALTYLSRSVACDGTKPSGTFYFTETNDIRTKTRKPNFAATIGKLRQLGHRAEIIGSEMPGGKNDVMGAMLGSKQTPWNESRSQIQAGAIVDNLTSLGAVFGSKSAHTPCTDFLKFGAAGSSGTVVEPFALQQKFPHPMMHVHYVRGCSLAESFYQSVEGPYQLLIVGDALCQPWADFPKLDVRPITSPVSGTITIGLKLAEKSPPVMGFEIYLDGKLMSRRSGISDFAFESENVADGYHELRIVGVGNNVIRACGRVILPIEVANHGHFATLTSEKKEVDEADQITFQAKTNVGNKLRLMCGAETMGEVAKSSHKFTIAASRLGRGTVTLYAVALDEQGREVRSSPIDIQINGPIRNQTIAVAPAKK